MSVWTEPGQGMAGSGSKSQMETDLDRANERLSFYEQFDEIIQQNIASSSALLKEASARFDSDVAEQRGKYRALLSEILDDLTVLQAQSERLARRVNDALDELETGHAATSEPAVASIAPPGLITQAPPEAAAVVNAATSGPGKRPDRTKAASTAAVAAAATTASIAPAASSSVIPPIAPVVEMPPSGPTSTTLLVHGVPRASAALGLKSYIEKLDFVTTVEPREFAAGLLRLQIYGSRPLTLADLSGWPMAGRIELKTASNDLLELGLTPA